MDLLVNGEPQSFDGDVLTVEELLHRMDVTQQGGIAVALNFAVVPRSAWADEQVRDGDEIEIVRATQGG